MLIRMVCVEFFLTVCADCLLARLAISIARKLGTTIFLLPEDIVAVRQKLVWTVSRMVVYAIRCMTDFLVHCLTHGASTPLIDILMN